MAGAVAVLLKFFGSDKFEDRQVVERGLEILAEGEDVAIDGA